MKSEQLKIETLTIDGELYAEYFIQGSTLYLKVVKNIGYTYAARTEDICIKVISALTGIPIHKVAPLNLIET